MIRDNYKEINHQLLCEHETWENMIFKPYLKGKEGQLSVPFRFGIPKRYLDSDTKLMIIGQEPHNFGTLYDQWDDPQKWGIYYLERQLYGEHREDAEYRKFNRSPFWNFFRKFSKDGMDPCWNNIDKPHRYCYQEGKEPLIHGDDCDYRYTTRLSEEDENVLSVQYENKGIYASLLQREIKIANPDVIIFICGPKYDESICMAFGLKKDSLKDVLPRIDKPVTEISKIIGLDIPVYWTYHPNFLHFRKGTTMEVFSYIKEDLKQR